MPQSTSGAGETASGLFPPTRGRSRSRGHTLFAQVNAETQPQDDRDPDPSGPESGPEAFARTEATAGEWIDLELLPRTW